EIGDEVEALAARLGHSFVLSVLHEPIQSACRLATSPDLAAYEASAWHHLEVAGALGFRHISGAILAYAAFLRGDWDEALRRAEEAVRHSPEHHHTSGMDWGCYLRVLAYSGRAADVLTIVDGWRDDFPRSGRPNGYGPWYLPAAAVEALFVVGERDRAAGFHPLVRGVITSPGVGMTVFCP